MVEVTFVWTKMIAMRAKGLRMKITLALFVLFTLFAISVFLWGRYFIPILDSFY